MFSRDVFKSLAVTSAALHLAEDFGFFFVVRLQMYVCIPECLLSEISFCEA